MNEKFIVVLANEKPVIVNLDNVISITQTDNGCRIVTLKGDDIHTSTLFKDIRTLVKGKEEIKLT